LDLPLAGAFIVKAPPPPDPTKFGSKTVKLAAKNEEIAAAWGGKFTPPNTLL
jgi:hypothetical protein